MRAIQCVALQISGSCRTRKVNINLSSLLVLERNPIAAIGLISSAPVHSQRTRGAPGRRDLRDTAPDLDPTKHETRTPTFLISTEGNMSRDASASHCSVRRSRRPQARLETSYTRTGRPPKHLLPNLTAGRRVKAVAIRPACTLRRSHTAE